MKNKEIRISRSKLLMKGCLILFLLLLLFSFVSFLTAGSFKFWNAWVFIGEFFMLEFFFVIYLVLLEPELLRKRFNLREKEKTQRVFNIIMYIVAFITVLILPGLDFRYHWSHVPVWIVVAASAVMLFGFIMEAIVMKQNVYTSRVIEIQEGQKVIDTGFYSIVRHPMYLFGIITICFMPLILGSFYAFILMIIVGPLLFTIRIKNEEEVLKDKLSGYKEYMQKVNYRLIPFIW